MEFCILNCSMPSLFQSISNPEFLTAKRRWSPKRTVNSMRVSVIHEDWKCVPKHLCDVSGKREATMGYLRKSMQIEATVRCPYKVRVTTSVTESMFYPWKWTAWRTEWPLSGGSEVLYYVHFSWRCSVLEITLHFQLKYNQSLLSELTLIMEPFCFIATHLEFHGFATATFKDIHHVFW